MPKIETGKIYIGVTCQECGQHAPFLELKPGEEFRAGGEIEIEVVCPSCGHTADYPVSAFRPMEAHRVH